MANCKICGQPVQAEPVMHGECLEQLVSDIAEKFCDGYCRWPKECASEEELRNRCQNCPAEQLMQLAEKKGGGSGAVDYG